MNPTLLESATTLASIQGRQAYQKQIIAAICRGNCCRVLGPRYRYKSHLLRQTAAALQDQGTHVTALLPLSDVAADDESSFFTTLYQEIKRQLQLPGADAWHGTTLEAPTFQYALLALAEQSKRDLALIVDDLEKAPPNLVALLLGTLRTVFTMLVNAPGARFQAVVGGSLSLSQVALDNVSRFESVSDLVLVGDLDEGEQTGLVHSLCAGAGVRPQPPAVVALLAQTGGDPFFIEEVVDLCLDELHGRSTPVLTESVVARAVSRFCQRAPYMIAADVIRHIETDPDLLSCAVTILEHGDDVPGNELPVDINKTPSSLDLCGAFAQLGDRYDIREGLWRQILRDHLTPSRTGSLYAIAGDWTRAIRYLGHAVQEGGTTRRAELHAATINAIHASRDTEEAFHYLADGLHALYPAGDVRLYQRQEGALRPISPERQLLLLQDQQRPEVEALFGPAYSTATVDGASRLLFPLRTGAIETTEVIGLASFRPPVRDSVYEWRDEIEQLISFLRQAARAIDTKMQFAELLETTTQRARTLRTLNAILTRILHRRDDDTDAMLRVALAGITHGWGMGFNRAVFFAPDEQEQALSGTLAVGHLTRAAAEAEWEAFPHNRRPLAEWLATLFDNLEEKARPHEPLQRRVEAIHVPLSEESEDVLTRSYRERLAFRGSPLQRLVGFSPAFVDVLDPPPEFAVVPLPAAEHVLGVLYVDNKFTGRAITAERFELLQSFTSQVALIIENARVLSIEREQSERLRRLRSQHMTFVTGAIHELSGAVANIPDVVGELERKIARGDDISAPIAALNRSACNAKEVMSRLHDLNLPPFKLQLTALRNLVQRAILDTLSQRPRHVVIHFAQDSPDPLVRADKAWLKLLFRNLIKNAYEAIPADREGRVEVRIVQTTEGDVKITVKDNGSGIAPEDQERIFEAGYSTKPHTSSFAGMGLAFCRQVAEEHGGTLTVEGEPDGGAMFTLLLPGEGSS